MAKPGDIPKTTKKVTEPEVKPYVEKNIDTYGFEKTIAELENQGFYPRKKDGVLYVELLKGQEFDENYNKVQQIISKKKFRGSWGVCY